MAEEILKEDWKANHDIGHETLSLYSYQLLCYFLASQPLSSIAEKAVRGNYGSYHERQEISKLLIAIATYYRVKYDDGSWEHAEWLHDKYEGVGTLIKDVTFSEKESLKFRDACNKIIHATKVNFDVEVNPETSLSYLLPTLYLYGEFRGSTWKTELNVIEFCKAAQNVIV